MILTKKKILQYNLRAMFNHIPPTSSLIWSFDSKSNHIRELFREHGGIGGLTSVSHRHFDLTGGNESPWTARHTPNNEKLTRCTLIDFNALV